MSFDLATAIGRLEQDVEDAMGSAEPLTVFCYNAKEICREYRALEAAVRERDAYAERSSALLRECAPMVTLKLCVQITELLKAFQTRQQGGNSDLPGSVRTEMGAVGPASECKEVIAARERLEPEGASGAITASDARNGVTGRRDGHSPNDALTANRYPEGWKLVPVELPEVMRIEGFASSAGKVGARALWRRMLEVAPQPPIDACEEAFDDLDHLLASVAGVPCRFCHGPGNADGRCPDCGEPLDAPENPNPSTDGGVEADTQGRAEPRSTPPNGNSDSPSDRGSSAPPVLPALRLADEFGDPETLLNSRDWMRKAIEAKGAKITGGGIGCGQADLDFDLEGCKFNVSLRPIFARVSSTEKRS